MKRFLLRYQPAIALAFLCLAAVQAPAQTLGECTVHAGAGTGKALATAPVADHSIKACVDKIPKAGDYTLKVKATKLAEPPVVTPPVVTPPAASWVLVGPEKAVYTLPGRYKVRFGTGTGVWAVRVIEGSFSCGTTLFGDPAPGAAKRCERESVVTTEPVTAAPTPEQPTTPTTPTEPTPPPLPPTTPQPSIGGVPKPGDFAGYPVQGPVTLQSGAVLRKVRVTGPGNCVSIAPGATGVLIEDVEIGPCGDTSDNSLGVRVGTGASNVTVRRSYIHHVSGGLYSDAGRHPIVFDLNLVTNIRGPNDRRQASRGQMVQLNGQREGSGQTRITCNVSDQATPDHAVEDHINLYNSAGTPSQPIEVAYNRMRGGHPTSNSGSGIMTGDGSLGGHIWAHHNTIVNVRNVGIGVAGGVGVRVENNRIYLNKAVIWSNVGLYVWSQGGGACSGHAVKNNRVWVDSAQSGGQNPWWNGGNCGPVDLAGNTFGDASLTAAIFDEVPAECQ